MNKKCAGVCVLIYLAYCCLHNAAIAQNPFKKDYRTKNAQYLYNVYKQDEKDRYRKEKMDLLPSGFMTQEEYELLSAPVDKTKIQNEIPKVQKPSDMKYVPQPNYKIVRYNNPPGSPEISMKRKLYSARQQNAQGITSPDYSMMVYPAVYYYPENAGIACDLFVIPLEGKTTPLNKILTADIKHRNPVPILSTDKSIDNMYTFRTLTPIDFSYDSTKLLVKEKIGSSHDGIWQTNVIVYDFENKTSYDLSELRAAIVYYWKQNKNLDLDDKRWDIYPLGFELMSPDRVVVNAYAYTGEVPVFLGTWSIDSKGEQTRLISFTPKEVKIAMNGYKIVQEGVVSPDILKVEEKQTKRFEKSEEKLKKSAEKAKLNEINSEHKTNMKELKDQFNADKKEFNYQDRIEGSTSTNNAVEKYKDEKVLRDLKEEQKLDKKRLNDIEKQIKESEKEASKVEKEQSDLTPMPRK